MRYSKLAVLGLLFFTASARAETLWEMYQSQQRNPLGLMYSKPKDPEFERQSEEQFREHQRLERERQDKSREEMRRITSEPVGQPLTPRCHTVLVLESGQYVSKKLCE